MENKILMLALGLSCLTAKAADPQPNILWIITDDQRADALECFNRATTGKSESKLGYVSSPNIDKLAEEGVLFTRSYCNSPASAPSRGSMHTGRYPFHSGIYNFQLTHNTNDFAKPLVPEIMAEHGYRTMSFGKTGFYIFQYSDPMGYRESPVYHQRAQMESDLERVGVTDWCKKAIYNPNDGPKGTKELWYYPDGRVVSYYMSREDGELTKEDIETAAKFREEQEIILTPVGNSGMILAGENTMPTHLTLDGRITEEFCRYFDNEGESYKLLSGLRSVEGIDPSEPQFLHLGYHFPHTAVMPSKEYRDKFKNREYNIPEFTEEEFGKMPPQLQKWSIKSSIGELTDKEMLQCIQDYYAFCAMGDQLVGEAVERFKRYCNEKDQPYMIVYACGDHGWHLGEQGVCAKFTNYLKSNETAVIVSSSDKSKFPDGKVVTDYVEYVDFAPTFFSAAGVDLSDDFYDYLDGRDLAQTASGEVAGRDYVLGEGAMIFGHRAYMRSDDFAFSMRSRPTNGNPSVTNPPNDNVKWALNCTPTEGEYALFDLRVDPEELNNVAYEEEYAELAEWLRVKLCSIVLGDGRLEVDWSVKNSYNISNFAEGSDDKLLDIPKSIIPKVY
ncbi:MAG: sulfatase-like hydrolase/transferase [Rikenellaceae bacterium]